MAIKTEILKQGHKYQSSEYQSFEFPKGKALTKIMIELTEITDCTGNRVAETSLHYIKIRVNDKEIMNIGGEQAAATETWGLLVLDQWHLQKHGQAVPSEQWYISFPTPLPKNAKVELILKQASMAENGCSSDDLKAYYNISFEYDDAYVGKHIIPHVTWVEFDDAALSGDLYHYIPPSPAGKKLRAIYFVTEDSATPATATYDFLTVSTPEKVYINNMSMAALKAKQEGESGYALTAGYFVVKFPNGIKVEPQTLLFNFNNAAAGSAVVIHMLLISY